MIRDGRKGFCQVPERGRSAGTRAFLFAVELDSAHLGLIFVCGRIRPFPSNSDKKEAMWERPHDLF